MPSIEDLYITSGVGRRQEEANRIIKDPRSPQTQTVLPAAVWPTVPQPAFKPEPAGSGKLHQPSNKTVRGQKSSHQFSFNINMFSVALILLLAAGSCVNSIDLIQPDSMVVQPGQSLTITCQVSGYSLTDNNSYATAWIRQCEGKPMDWIFEMWGGGSFYQNDALKNKFSYSRDTSAGTVTIKGQNLQPEDSAVYYYCAR
ncbi:hypothetical protein L3Q82_014320 [Scortum barcoo]|uniref:Uncharacterized protein n=1 Tax=Scortum barcoo TaxID=214431 RepID=A0ACB8VWN5_9TELE|nr:hypothetical protein L3Q82_014320 [Scortum barcoo]